MYAPVQDMALFSMLPCSVVLSLRIEGFETKKDSVVVVDLWPAACSFKSWALTNTIQVSHRPRHARDGHSQELKRGIPVRVCLVHIYFTRLLTPHHRDSCARRHLES